MRRRLIIATRRSPLARWQATYVAKQLQYHYPQWDIAILALNTEGDNYLEQPLRQLGGKGLFVKALELALLKGQADIAVHAMKDVPMQLPNGFSIAAITQRAEACDAFIANDYANINELPENAIVGTASLRRRAQLLAAYPHLKIQPLRGNLQTRLAKLDRGEYQAIILAAAGLKRLGLEQRIRQRLSIDIYLPAPGQGALGIEVYANEQLVDLLQPLHHADSADCIIAERRMSACLHGSCQAPIAAYAEIVDEHSMRLKGLVARTDGSQMIVAQANASRIAAAALGEQVADLLLSEGAANLLVNPNV